LQVAAASTATFATKVLIAGSFARMP